MNSLLPGSSEEHLAADRVSPNIEEHIFVKEALWIILKDLGPEVSQSVFDIVDFVIMICGLNIGQPWNPIPNYAPTRDSGNRSERWPSSGTAFRTASILVVELPVSGRDHSQCRAGASRYNRRAFRAKQADRFGNRIGINIPTPS